MNNRIQLSLSALLDNCEIGNIVSPVATCDEGARLLGKRISLKAKVWEIVRDFDDEALSEVSVQDVLSRLGSFSLLHLLPILDHIESSLDARRSEVCEKVISSMRLKL